jgi:hypothetical protein
LEQVHLCEIGLIEGSCRTYGGPDFPSIVHFCLLRKDIDAWEGVNRRRAGAVARAAEMIGGDFAGARNPGTNGAAIGI